MKLPWITIAKFAGTALLAVAGTVGMQEATKSISIPRAEPVAAVLTQPCPACNPTLKCPEIPKQVCDIRVNGVPLK